MDFTTTTLINSNLDPDSGKELFVGTEGKLRILRDFDFLKDNVVSVKYAEGHEAEQCVATVDFSKVLSSINTNPVNYCRLDIYLYFEGAEPFYGANPLHVRKGIPFWVEFTVKEGETDGEAVAKEVKKLIEKNNLFVIDKSQITVTVEGAVLTLTGNTEYQRFKTIELHTFDETSVYSTLVAEIGDEAIQVTTVGENGFGTYSQIVKDLRLPTAANYQWTHLRQAETPIVGATYNQFIITYKAPASNHGTIFVGHRGESLTTHIFWVNSEVSDDFKTAVETAFGVTLA